MVGHSNTFLTFFYFSNKSAALVVATSFVLRLLKSEKILEIPRDLGEAQEIRKQLLKHNFGQWGSRGRRFDSCHSDHIRTLILIR